ncbi:DNA-binding response regulator, OmpR family, contains REC and winged-helix (wHTH) domain [Paenimyroides ummariense]|uniref:DNA-binding response regulator, OmpR family, contains REC and winged-helix (WHTH) domain n=1 Tax=Paenimyroides ummariense TaxID=913024 RepID=A0A1I4XJ17_9FLAO|nr:response regulator transcription factor [Paenimyroides ummariense]SFN25928.1 DNA-binding response regulator, OmpR family, contains REC and winged-helix (wHTH) domain [Paenimyroides ummariense]
MKYRILYAEDDETIAFLTQDSLQPNYEVVYCVDGKSALEIFKSQPFDICLFDIMMPKLDGFELAQEIRNLNSEIPIIFISAKTLKEDRIKGLKIGADDYLIKPFSIEELILKIEIFLKRTQKNNSETYLPKVGKYIFDSKNYRLSNASEIITLTQRESELLKYFIDHKNSVVKREEILKALWGDDDYFMGRSLDVFISRLRKIFADDDSVSIENLHGIGFKFYEK